MEKADSLRIAGIVRESIVDGPGIRFVVFCQGCPHDCPGCHNPDSHDFGGGQECSIERILQEIDKNPLLAGVTFSGGEPMCQPKAFAELAQAVKERGLDITLFSGYTYEEIQDMATAETHEGRAVSQLISLTDILIDGRFVSGLRDLTLQFRGSSNQRVIDMNRTREMGEIVLWN